MQQANIYRNNKVVIIDDMEIDRYIAQRVLIHSAFAKEVLSFEDGPSALDYLRFIDNKEELPNMILLDISMPNMDGFEFLDRFNELPDFVKKNLPVAVLSSSHHVNDYRKAESYNAVIEFINKPLTAEKLESINLAAAVKYCK